MAVFDANGNRLSKSSAQALTSAAPNPNLVANADMYDGVFTGFADVNADGKVRRLLVRNGQTITTDTLNKLFPAPVIDSVYPSASVPAAGGTVITVKGANLDGVTAVTVGGTAATAVAYSVAGTKLVFTTPAKTAGTYSVVLTDDSGQVTINNALTFV